MALLSGRGLDLNELRWWSNWAKLKRLGKGAYLLTSYQFNEPFFNRALFADCKAALLFAGKAERELRRLGLPPTMTVNSACELATKKLLRSGYRTIETMTVMVSRGSSKPPVAAEFEVRRTTTRTVGEWSKTYLLSFYDSELLMPAVTRIVQRLVRTRVVTLLEAVEGGVVAGVLAIFRTPHLAGVYCVGTLPEFRRRGVAGTLLGKAFAIAASEGRRLVLQTLKSDGAEEFYVKRGFTKAYEKYFVGQES